MALEAAPLKAEKPNGDEVELTNLFAFTYAYHAPASLADVPAKLPSTASSSPLVGGLALLLMGIAMGLRLRASRVK
jgi:hypothetical protein